MKETDDNIPNDSFDLLAITDSRIEYLEKRLEFWNYRVRKLENTRLSRELKEAKQMVADLKAELEELRSYRERLQYTEKKIIPAIVVHKTPQRETRSVGDSGRYKISCLLITLAFIALEAESILHGLEGFKTASLFTSTIIAGVLAYWKLGGSK
jgi:hypothetical protein